MSLNETASAERFHIGFFGMRNAGKSSVVNAVTGQKLALVSDIKGTTTDPVQKAMELLPLGPVVIIDTPGIDDEGELGKMRVERAVRMLDKTDAAVLVVDAVTGVRPYDEELVKEFKKRKVPYIIAMNKADLLEPVAGQDHFSEDDQLAEQGQLKGQGKLEERGQLEGQGQLKGQGQPAEQEDAQEGSCTQHLFDPTFGMNNNNVIFISALNGTNIYELKEMLGKIAGQKKNSKKLVGDLLSPKDVVILVTPIDESAPKGRMILPQQQMIRDVLDHDSINIVVKETELAFALSMLKEKPRMVITDSQAFGKVNSIVPLDIPLTSFSILFARYKGELEVFVKGAHKLDDLKDGDRVLISEGCTHHRQCNDIGTVKLPGWIRGYCEKELSFEFTSGGEFPQDISMYSLIVHCGGCMLNERELGSRIERAAKAGIPITNYGIAIAKMHGILERSLSPFEKIRQ